jgi:hypothetical protein
MHFPINLKKYEHHLPHILLLSILLGGLWVRIVGIREFYYNADEMEFLLIAKGETLLEVWRRGLAELHPPLAHFIRHYLLMLTPEVFHQRLFSIAAGLISVVGIYRFGLQAGGRFLGLFCAACLAFIPVSVSVSMTIRNYSFFMAFVTWGLYYYCRYQHQEKRSDLLKFILFIFLASATHFTGFLIATACGLTEGGRLLTQKRWQDLAIVCLSFVPLLCLGIFLYWHFLAPGTAGPMWHNLLIGMGYEPKDFYERINSTFLAIFGYFVPIFNMVILSPFSDVSLFFVTLFLLMFYIYCLIIIFKHNRWHAYLISGVWIIAVIASVIDYYPFTSGRHVYYIMPFIALSYGFGIKKLVEKFNNKIGIFVFSVILFSYIILLVMKGVYIAYGLEFSLEKNSIKLAFKYLDSRLHPKDIIVTKRIAGYHYFLNNKDQGKSPYDRYANVSYHSATLIAPFDPPFKPHSSWEPFRNNLKTRINSNITTPVNNVWFVMLGWKDHEIERLMQCKPIQTKIQNYFTQDGVLIFSINTSTFSEFLDKKDIWESCYSDYRSTLIIETFKMYPPLVQLNK